MLVLSRTAGESITVQIGDEVLTIHISQLIRNRVKLSFEGSARFQIARTEIVPMHRKESKPCQRS